MTTVIALEKQLSDAKKLIEFRRMALKLAQNREFKKLILEEFCTYECARYAQNSSNPALGAEERADALAIAQAAGALKRWLSVQVQMGQHAENEIEDLEQALVEARSEDGVDVEDAQDEDVGQ